MLNGLAIMALLSAVIGLLLSLLAKKTQANKDSLVQAIEDLLPQTQCGQCNYPGCAPYAQAIAAQQAPINCCPPGGEKTIEALATLLGQETLPLDPSYGAEEIPQQAFIREADCIGCVKCIQACPVDAILGSNQLMHSVIPELCTGCSLCVDPCPVDCIEMHPVVIN